MNRDDKTFIRRKLREYDDEVIGIFQRQRKPISKIQLIQTISSCKMTYEN